MSCWQNWISIFFNKCNCSLSFHNYLCLFYFLYFFWFHRERNAWLQSICYPHNWDSNVGDCIPCLPDSSCQFLGRWENMLLFYVRLKAQPIPSLNFLLTNQQRWNYSWLYPSFKGSSVLNFRRIGERTHVLKAIIERRAGTENYLELWKIRRLDSK